MRQTLGQTCKPTKSASIENRLVFCGCVGMLGRMEVLARWSSLSDQVKLTAELFGPLTGEQ
jgi:hypothetical protein